MRTKNELMGLVAHGVLREVFVHSEWGSFDVTDMRHKAPAIAEVMWVSLHDILPYIKRDRVTEDSRILALPDASWQEDPGIVVVGAERGDISHLLIDGHHRALRREREGKTDMAFWFFTMPQVSRPPENAVARKDLDWGDPIVDGRIVRGATKC